MTPEQRLEMVTNQVDSLTTWLTRQINHEHATGNEYTAYALDDVLIKLGRITRTLKEKK